MRIKRILNLENLETLKLKLPGSIRGIPLAGSLYFLCCYIYKFNIDTTDILTSLNILIEILIMIMQYLFFSSSINHNHPNNPVKLCLLKSSHRVGNNFLYNGRVYLLSRVVVFGNLILIVNSDLIMIFKYIDRDIDNDYAIFIFFIFDKSQSSG
jgi:hypothetical protein